MNQPATDLATSDTPRVDALVKFGENLAAFDDADPRDQECYAYMTGLARTLESELALEKVAHEVTQKDRDELENMHAELQSAARLSRNDINEVWCAMFNRIRSERAFDKYEGIAERAKDRLTAALGDPA